MRTLFLIVNFSLFTIAFAQTHLYENPEFKDIAKRHSTIGVLPFTVNINLPPKQLNNINPKQLEIIKTTEGLGIQHEINSWFLNLDKKGSLKVEILSTDIVNSKLEKAGISVNNIDEYAIFDLAKILEVDALVKGTFETPKPLTDTTSDSLKEMITLNGCENDAVINLFIYNTQGNELLLNYNKSIPIGKESTTKDIVKITMRKICKKIYYIK